MRPNEKFRDYTDAVCEQIRWSRARAAVAEELEQHLADQRDAYMAQGEDAAAAAEMAVTQMGDPVAVGAQLDRTHRPRPQLGMLLLVAGIICIGLAIQVFLLSRTSGFDPQTLMPIFYTLAGTAVMAAAYFLDMSWIGRFSVWFYLALLFFMTGNFITRMFIDPFGFFLLGGIVPMLFPLGFAGVVYAAHNRGWRGFMLCAAAFMLPALMLFAMRWRDDCMLLTVSAFVILCVAMFKGWFNINKRTGWLAIAAVAAIALALAALYISQYGYRWDKLLAKLNPSLDPAGEGAWGIQIKTLLAHSRLWGQGDIPVLPLDEQPWSGWSAPLVFTYLIFDVGWIPFLMFMAVLLVFMVLGFRLAFKQQSSLAQFVAMAVMTTLALKVMGYVLANLGITLFSGMSMPFVPGYGYTDYFINMALTGLMLSAFRTGSLYRDTRFGRQPLFIGRDGKSVFPSRRKQTG